MRKIALLILAATSLLTASSASLAYGYFGYGGYYGHRGFGPRVGITIGGPVYWGPPPVYYTPPTYYPPPVYYVAPAPAPQTYIEQEPEYRYYCPNPSGYYPDIPRCPQGWLKVAPGDNQPR